MPVHKCPNGLYRIGSGKCMYKSKEAAEKAYKAYLAQKHSDNKNESAIELEVEDLLNKISKERTSLWELEDVLNSIKVLLGYGDNI